MMNNNRSPEKDTFVSSLIHYAPYWGLKDLPQGKESYQNETEVGLWVYSDLEST